jgi:hypothetical protein
LWPQDIGGWQGIFTFVSCVSVITNLAIVLFNTSSFTKDNYLSNTWTFIVLQYVIFAGMVGVMMYVPDEPYEVKVQRQRNAWIVSKLIDKTADEDEEEADVDNEGAEANLKRILPQDCVRRQSIARPRSPMMAFGQTVKSLANRSTVAPDGGGAFKGDKGRRGSEEAV